MVPVKDLNEWAIENREVFLTSNRVGELIGCSSDETAIRVRLLREAGDIARVCREGWVVGRKGMFPFLSEYIDRMMCHLKLPYYMGFRSAAETAHNAAHQISNLNQIATTRTERKNITAGQWRQMIRTRGVATAPTVTVNIGSLLTPGTPMPTVRCSTAEITLLDMVSNPSAGGSWYNVANTAAEMLERYAPPDADPEHSKPIIDPEILAEMALRYPVSVRQRCGYVVAEMSDYMEVPFDLAPLRDTIPHNSRPVCLHARPFGTPKGWQPDTYLYDSHWRVKDDDKFPLGCDL